MSEGEQSKAKPNTSFIVEVPISWLVFMIAVIFQEKKTIGSHFFASLAPPKFIISHMCNSNIEDVFYYHQNMRSV